MTRAPTAHDIAALARTALDSVPAPFAALHALEAGS
jgi:hypothetical protein